jgi:CheY-like chemotaxis protein
MKRKNFTVLIAEDNTDDQELIRLAFEKASSGVNLQLVSSGEETIAYLEGRREFADRKQYPYPTFVITDLKMPLEDGFSVLGFLKSKPDFAVIPTVVLSASADLDDIKKSYILGASAYMLKPQEFAELERLLRLLLDFWSACEVPEVSATGKRLETQSAGKLGERIQE